MRNKPSINIDNPAGALLHHFIRQRLDKSNPLTIFMVIKFVVPDIASRDPQSLDIATDAATTTSG